MGNEEPYNPYPVIYCPEIDKANIPEIQKRRNKLKIQAIGLVDWLFRHIKSPPLDGNPLAVSIGCGFGHDLNELKSHGWQVLGLDADSSFRK